MPSLNLLLHPVSEAFSILYEVSDEIFIAFDSAVQGCVRNLCVRNLIEMIVFFCHPFEFASELSR